MADLYEQAQQMYPRLEKGLAYRENFGGGQGYIEYYPKGERDSFDQNRAAVEVFNRKTRPQDVAADIVSHHMTENDPVVSNLYSKLVGSMDLSQQHKLNNQYKYAQKNYGEKRPFNDWAMISGYPGWLRGGAFEQWKNPENIYRPEQIDTLKMLVNYLKGAR